MLKNDLNSFVIKTLHIEVPVYNRLRCKLDKKKNLDTTTTQNYLYFSSIAASQMSSNIRFSSTVGSDQCKLSALTY